MAPKKGVREVRVYSWEAFDMQVGNMLPPCESSVCYQTKIREAFFYLGFLISSNDANLIHHHQLSFFMNRTTLTKKAVFGYGIPISQSVISLSFLS